MKFETRSIVAVFAGIVAFLAEVVCAFEILSLLVPVDNRPMAHMGHMIMVLLASGPIAAFVSGFVTAEIAGRNPLQHWAAIAAVLGLIPVIAAIVGGAGGFVVALPVFALCLASGALGAAASSWVSEPHRPPPPPPPRPSSTGPSDENS